ncbi:MAG: C-terminal binding protein [Spirochaetes bacterium]|nr:C-terminal binding protein [Spirochaetota bacterium]
MPKTIVTAGDRVYLKFFDLEYFEKRAVEADAVIDRCTSLDEHEFSGRIQGADALIVIDRPVLRTHVEKMERCRIVLALEVGYDFIDVGACSQRGIVVSNMPLYCTGEVALHAFMLLLAVQRKLKPLMAETAGGGWDYNVCKPLCFTAGKKLGIIGLGRIGRRMVPKAKAFGMEPVAYDPYVADDIFELTGAARCYELDELLSTVDCVTLHVPLTNETRHMIGARELRLMKKEAILVNTCRGMVVDEKSLYVALSDGIIAGAGLDVLETEPPESTNPLLHCAQCIVTPHVAWYSKESLDRLKVQGMDEVVRVLNGGRPRYAVNPEVLS